MKLSLATITRRLASKTDADLGAELAQLKDDRRALHRLHDGRLRSQSHERIDALAAEARERFGSYVSANSVDFVRASLYSPHGGTLGLVELSALWAAGNSPEYLATLHAAVDANAERFSPLSGKEFEQQLARFESEIGDRTVELERRHIAARKEDADREATEALERLVAS